MYCTNFTFDGETSQAHGVMICSFNDSSDANITIGSKIEMSTFKPPNSCKWYKTNTSYTEQLSITFSICKNIYDGNINGYFTEPEIVDIQMWLCKKKFSFLNFNQEGYTDIYYNALLSLEKQTVGGRVIGFNITATCDAPFGYSDLITKTFAVGENGNFSITSNSEEIGHIIPDVILKLSSPGDFVITNSLTKKSTKISNCVSGETIELKNTMRLTGSENETNHKTILDDFNWEFPTISRSYQNNINSYTVSLPCNIKFEYREIRKAVI